MKKIMTLFLGLAALCLTTGNLQAQDPSPLKPFTGKIRGDKVRMRLSPFLEGQIYKELNKGDLISVKKLEGDFFAVQPPEGTKAYIFRTYVLDGIVEGSNVNIRLGPDLESPVIAQLSTGDNVSGLISPDNSKWMEIDIPENTYFYVAKEYVDYAGDAHYIARVENRQKEASQALNNAYLLSQSELRKPFEEINFELVESKFSYVIDEYSDYPTEVAKAKKALESTQDAYLHKKLAYLERKAEQTPREEVARDTSALEVVDIKAYDQETITWTSEEVTEKMKVWEPLEEAAYQEWLAKNPNKTKEDFYQEQRVYADIISGNVEPYHEVVKNKPGDYLLKVNNKPVAYLYSTAIDLQGKVGEYTTLTVAPRSNNNFAFPAYYVLSVE
ncbi:MAG: SH3 domain-containing protein [Chlamydiota bacterium]